MLKWLLFTITLAFADVAQAQKETTELNEGSILILGKTSGAQYRYIDFPKKNIIIKRGALANFNALIGEKLIVTGKKIDKNGNEIAILKRKNKKNFFRFYPKVTVQLDKALAAGELQRSL